MPKFPIYFLLLFFLLVGLSSCEEETIVSEVEMAEEIIEADFTDRFFNPTYLSDSNPNLKPLSTLNGTQNFTGVSDAYIQDLTAEIKSFVKANNSKKRLKELSKKIGFPIWDRATYLPSNPNLDFLLIPFAFENGVEVEGVLIVHRDLENGGFAIKLPKRKTLKKAIKNPNKDKHRNIAIHAMDFVSHDLKLFGTYDEVLYAFWEANQTGGSTEQLVGDTRPSNFECEWIETEMISSYSLGCAEPILAFSCLGTYRIPDASCEHGEREFCNYYYTVSRYTCNGGGGSGGGSTGGNNTGGGGSTNNDPYDPGTDEGDSDSDDPQESYYYCNLIGFNRCWEYCGDAICSDEDENLYDCFVNNSGCAELGKCLKLEASMDIGDDFRDKLLGLNSNLNSNFESMAIALQDGTTKEDSGNSGQPHIDLPSETSPYTQIAHTHPNNSDIQTYSVFSYGDMRRFSELLYNGKMVNDCVLYLATGKGTHYALTIETKMKFANAFYFWNVGSLDLSASTSDKTRFINSMSMMKELEYKYYGSLNNPNPNALILETNTNNEEVLGYFLDFLEEADIGVNLFESDSNFQNFKKVSKQNGVIQKEEC